MLESGAVVAMPASSGSYYLKGQDEYSMDRGEMMSRFPEEASERVDTDRNSLTVTRVASVLWI